MKNYLHVDIVLMEINQLIQCMSSLLLSYQLSSDNTKKSFKKLQQI